MSKKGLSAIIMLFLAVLALQSCSQIVTQTFISYSSPDFPPLNRSLEDEPLTVIDIAGAPLPKDETPETSSQDQPDESSQAVPPVDTQTPTTNPQQSEPPKSNLVTTPASAEYPSFTLNGLHDDVLLQETEDAGQEYVDGTCFIGDSITLGLKVFKIIPEERVFAEGSIDPYAAGHNKMVTLPDSRQVTAPQAVGYYKPQRVVITLGTNSVSWCPEKSFLSSYGQLIDDIRAESPNTAIIIQAIPPVTETYESTAVKLTNETINHFNVLLLDLAAEKQVYFLNTASALKNDRGFFQDNFQSGDGLHHNQSCYGVWLSYLRTHAIPSDSATDASLVPQDSTEVA